MSNTQKIALVKFCVYVRINIVLVHHRKKLTHFA